MSFLLIPDFVVVEVVIIWGFPLLGVTVEVSSVVPVEAVTTTTVVGFSCNELEWTVLSVGVGCTVTVVVVTLRRSVVVLVMPVWS